MYFRDWFHQAVSRHLPHSQNHSETFLPKLQWQMDLGLSSANTCCTCAAAHRSIKDQMIHPKGFQAPLDYTKSTFCRSGISTLCICLGDLVFTDSVRSSRRASGRQRLIHIYDRFPKITKLNVKWWKSSKFSPYEHVPACQAQRWDSHVSTVKRQRLLKVCRDHAAAKKPKPIAAELGHARAVLTAPGEGGGRWREARAVACFSLSPSDWQLLHVNNQPSSNDGAAQSEFPF